MNCEHFVEILREMVHVMRRKAI